MKEKKKVLNLFYILLTSLFLSFAFAKNQIYNFDLIEKKRIWYADVNSKILLNKTIDESIKRGISLTFSYYFSFESEKWWGDLSIAEIRKNYQVSYNKTIQKYVIKNPITFEKFYFSQVKYMIDFMQKLYNFPLINKNQLSEKITFVKVKFELDKNKLPTLIKLESIFNNKWDIKSDWKIWQLP